MKTNLNSRAKLEVKESELEAARLRLSDAEKGLNESKAEADTLRAQSATGSANGDVDQIARRLLERVRAIEAEMVSMRWDEKSMKRWSVATRDEVNILNDATICNYLSQMRWPAFLTGILTHAHTPDYSVTQNRGRLHGCARTGRSPQSAFYSSIIPRFPSQRHLHVCYLTTIDTPFETETSGKAKGKPSPKFLNDNKDNNN